MVCMQLTSYIHSAPKRHVLPFCGYFIIIRQFSAARQCIEILQETEKHLFPSVTKGKYLL